MKAKPRNSMTLIEQEKVRQEFFNSQELQIAWKNDVDKYMAYRRAEFADLIRNHKISDTAIAPVFCSIVQQRDKEFYGTESPSPENQMNEKQVRL
jgi:hypothetical protein